MIAVQDFAVVNCFHTNGGFKIKRLLGLGEKASDFWHRSNNVSTLHAEPKMLSSEGHELPNRWPAITLVGRNQP